MGDFSAQYRTMSDEELMNIYMEREALEPEAREAIVAEFRIRHLREEDAVALKQELIREQRNIERKQSLVTRLGLIAPVSPASQANINAKLSRGIWRVAQVSTGCGVPQTSRVCLSGRQRVYSAGNAPPKTDHRPPTTLPHRKIGVLGLRASPRMAT
jgi:hypothetical protein